MESTKGEASTCKIMQFEAEAAGQAAAFITGSFMAVGPGSLVGLDLEPLTMIEQNLLSLEATTRYVTVMHKHQPNDLQRHRWRAGPRNCIIAFKADGLSKELELLLTPMAEVPSKIFIQSHIDNPPAADKRRLIADAPQFSVRGPVMA